MPQWLPFRPCSLHSCLLLWGLEMHGALPPLHSKTPHAPQTQRSIRRQSVRVIALSSGDGDVGPPYTLLLSHPQVQLLTHDADVSLDDFLLSVVRQAQPLMDIWLQPPSSESASSAAGPSPPPAASPLLQTVVRDAWQASWNSNHQCPEHLLASIAGAGNMNLSLRITSPDGSGKHRGVQQDTIDPPSSWVLKQSRPWVQAYPQYPAPVERIGVEAAWYTAANALPAVAHMVPSLAGMSRRFAAIMCEDLGVASDFTPLYAVTAAVPGNAEGRLREELLKDLKQTASFLGGLHGATRGGVPGFTQNNAMRELNAAHMYTIPFSADNPMWGGLDSIEGGLEAAATTVRKNTCVLATASALQQRYLLPLPVAGSAVLLHGDYFFGSWLRTKAGVFVIDAEFAHVGDAEFDVGVALAHMAMAQLPLHVAQSWLAEYQNSTAKCAAAPQEGSAQLDCGLVAQFAAVEIVRRLVGVAQIPQLSLPPGGRVALLQRATQCLQTTSPAAAAAPVESASATAGSTVGGDHANTWQQLWATALR